MAKLIQYNLPHCDVQAAVVGVRTIEARIGIPTPTAALTDIFGKAGLRLRYPPRSTILPKASGGPDGRSDVAANGVVNGGAAHSGSDGSDGSRNGSNPRTHDAEVEVSLRQVEEVLDEVASTNKKVFKSIHELLRFLGLDKCKTDGRTDAKGYTWLPIEEGALPPEAGRELVHEKLSAALVRPPAGKAAPPSPLEVRFSEDEWKAFKVVGLRFDHWIRASDGSYWRPDPHEDCKPHERPRPYGDAFESEGCADVKDCKQLNEHQLKDCIGIAKMGHRMKLLEQFRFL